MGRVLLINARYKNRPITGVERFASEVSSRLPQQCGADFQVTEVDPGRELSGLRGHAWEQFELPFLKKNKPKSSVLFSPCNTGPVAVARQFVVIHDAAVWDYPEGFSPVFAKFYQCLLPILAKRVALVGTVSEFSKERLSYFLGIPNSKIVVLGNAAGEQFVPPPKTHKNPVGQRFFSVASLEPRKNFASLIKAWNQLDADNRLAEDAELRIAGGTNPRNFSNVSSTCGPSNKIKWLGRISDTQLIIEYQQADAFVYPSLYEGFGLPPLESMACGTPVLMSNVASLPEVGGAAAFYFEPDEASIMASIERFIGLNSEERERLAVNALDRSQAFSWSTITKQVIGYLNEIC